MATVAVVYHSQYGHTKALAEAILKGVQSVSGVRGVLISTTELPSPGQDRKLGGRWDELNAADAMLLGSPTYMGAVSADFKRFMEASSALWFTQSWSGKLAGGFTNSGNLSGDKLNTLLQLVVFAGQHSMIWVPPGQMPSHYQPNDTKHINRLGSFLGLMAQSDQAPADQTPPAGDRLTAELYGQQMAQAAVRWLKGK
jgi:NAD(P)H dehydrogenase (quinone)